LGESPHRILHEFNQTLQSRSPSNENEERSNDQVDFQVTLEPLRSGNDTHLSQSHNPNGKYLLNRKLPKHSDIQNSPLQTLVESSIQLEQVPVNNHTANNPAALLLRAAKSPTFDLPTNAFNGQQMKRQSKRDVQLSQKIAQLQQDRQSKQVM